MGIIFLSWTSAFGGGEKHLAERIRCLDLFKVQPTILSHEPVGKANAGWLANPKDTSGIKQGLLTIVDHYQYNRSMPRARSDYVAQFRWDRVAEGLARVLNAAVSHGA